MNELIDIRNRLSTSEVQILVDCLEYPVDVRVEKTKEIIREYRDNPNQVILGMELNNELVGFIGICFQSEHTGIIKHIAVRRNYRRQGIGKRMIIETCKKYNFQEIIAETDKDAVAFYQKIGFEIQSLGEKYPGTERFLCRLSIDVSTS